MWEHTLTIIGTLGALVIWLDHRHQKEMDKMDERWKENDARWAKLFEKFHILDKEVSTLKGKKS